MREGTLEVRLVEGQGLTNTELFGKSDPYAIISCKNQNQKSSTIERGGSDPKWNQSFFYTVDEEVSEVTIKLLDEDSYSADDPIGTATIPLGNVFSDLEVPAACYDIIRPSGKVHGQLKVILKFVPKTPDPVPQHRFPHHNHNRLFLQHAKTEGPYGENTEGGWQQ